MQRRHSTADSSSSGRADQSASQPLVKLHPRSSLSRTLIPLPAKTASSCRHLLRPSEHHDEDDWSTAVDTVNSVSQLSPLKNVCKGHTQTRVAGGLHCQWKNMHSFIHWAPRYGVSNKQIGESESERERERERELAVAGKHRHQSTQKRVEV